MDSKLKKEINCIEEILERFYLEYKRGRLCRYCLGNLKSIKDNYLQLRCGRANCRKYHSIFKEQIFKNIKIPFLDVILIIKYFLSGCRSKSLVEIFRINKKTIYKIIRKLGLLIKDFYTFEKIGGQNIKVEIDESKFGKRKYNRGHSVEGVWVFGMVEKTPMRKIRLIPVLNRNADTLTRLLNMNVERGSIIQSDQWRGYNNINEYFTHNTVNHSLNFVNPLDGTHTNTIEGCWSAIKNFIPKKYRTNQNIDIFLNIFMFLRENQGNIILKILYLAKN